LLGSPLLYGVWKFQCITCNKLFSSSQAIAGNTKIHFEDDWVLGTFPNYQQLESSTTVDSSSTHQQQQIFSTSITDIDSPNSHQLGLSPVPIPPKKDLSFRDMKTRAILRDRLTKKENRVVLLPLDMAKK
ncbi:hypothetical protein EJD97_001218, partial [Solanum chilense]